MLTQCCIYPMLPWPGALTKEPEHAKIVYCQEALHPLLRTYKKQIRISCSDIEWAKRILHSTPACMCSTAFICICISSTCMHLCPDRCVQMHGHLIASIISIIHLNYVFCSRGCQNVGPEHQVGRESQMPIIKKFIWPLNFSIFSCIGWHKMSCACLL